MRAIHMLLSLLLVVCAVYCVVAWAYWSNEGFYPLFPVNLPVDAVELPGGPMNGPLATSMVTFVIAYLVYPPGKEPERQH